MTADFRRALLGWYDQHQRSMPWRGLRDPYAIWVSETMLQQTRVETVLRYFPRFMARFPNVQTLAEAPVEDVLKMWEGLGYYRRARNLHLGAQQVVSRFGGVMPRTVNELRQLHGIGAYTAGAIASIAYGLPEPAVDGNVIRVLSRACGIRENVGIPSVHRQLEAEAAALVDPERPGDFNQALMDLGAGICVPGTPDCSRCPLRSLCDACAQGDPEELPVLPRKNPPKVLDWDVCLIRSGDRLLMRPRTERMLEGMWVFPMLEGHHGVAQLPAAIRRQLKVPVQDAALLGDAKHVFTHQVWLMKLYAMQALDERMPAGYQFVTLEEMRALPCPTAMRAALMAAEKLLGA